MPISPEQGLRLVLTNPRITAIISDRIFPFRAPQGVARPLILYSRTSSTPEHHMRGVSGLRSVSFQVDGFADTYEGMQLLREATRQTVDGFRAAVSLNGESISFRHIFIENDSDAFVEPQAASDEPIYQFTMDLSAMCTESVPNR